MTGLDTRTVEDVQAELDAFKEQVRALVVNRVEVRQNIGREVGEDALEEWGLEPINPNRGWWMDTTAVIRTYVQARTPESARDVTMQRLARRLNYDYISLRVGTPEEYHGYIPQSDDDEG